MNLEDRGSAPAVIAFTAGEPKIWTGQRLARTARCLAAGLLARGLRPGAQLALWGPNSPEWIAIALGTMAAGGVLIPIDDLASVEQGQRLLAAGKTKWLFATAEHVEALGEEVGSVEHIVLVDADPGSPMAWTGMLADDPGKLPEVSPESPAVMLATSGTTGPPKVFELSHRNIAVNVAALAGAGIVTPDDRALVPLPLHHAYPLVVGMLTPLTIGTTVILPERISGLHLVGALRDGEATVIIGVPRLYEALLTGLRARIASYGRAVGSILGWLMALARALRVRGRANPGKFVFAALRRQIGPQLRLLVSGGAHLPADLQSDLETLGWQVLPGYGLAETASVFTAMLPREHRPGSAGRPLNDGEILIDAPDETGIGEILLRGPNITAGYVNNPQASAASFTGHGWFRTGDLGRVDHDGYLFVGGRLKEIITLAGGKKINPEELEKVYAVCPYVEEIAVLEIDGKIVALVRPNHKTLHEAGIIEPTHAIEVGLGEIMLGLPSYERLSGVAIAHEPLPRTRLGKCRRFLLPSIYQQAFVGGSEIKPENQTREFARLKDDPLAYEIMIHLRRRFPDRAIRLAGIPTLDLGLDSLGWVGLALELEQHFRIDLRDVELAEAATIEDLIDRVREARRTRPLHRRPATRYPDLTDPQRWLRPRNLLMRTAGLALFALNRAVIRLYFGLRVEGAQKLPIAGPYVVTPNHASSLDPLTLAAALPYAMLARAAWAGVARRLFRNVFTRWLCRVVHVFPVNEFRPETAIATAVEALDREQVLIWYPEGWRTPNGMMQEFRPGIGIILMRSNAPVVPAYIAGTFEALPRNRLFPRPVRLRVVFGDPVTPDILEVEGVGELPEDRIALALRARVQALGAQPDHRPLERVHSKWR